MRAEKYVVTTSVRGIKRSEIWNPAKPLSLGYQGNWILERTDAGVQVREKNGPLSHQVGHEILALPHDEIKLQIVPARHMSPPYQLPEGHVTASRSFQLLAFNGVGRGIISCQPVHTAYVAYVRKQPVFTLYHDGHNGFQIKPLLDGIKFKLKRQKPIAGPIGEIWNLSPDQLYGASVIRGSHWWRFNLVPTSAKLEDGPNEEELLNEEGVGLRKMLTILGVAFAALSLAVWVAPRQSKLAPEEPKEAPIVKFIAPKPVEHKVVAPVASESVKPPSVAAVPKADPVPVKGVTQEKVKKLAPVKVKPAPPVPMPDPKAAAQKASSAKLQMLRAALGGVAGLTQKSVGAPALSARTSGVFSGGSAALAQTEIRPAYSADNTKVGAVGGGYTKGEHAAVSGQGSSFVEVDAGGPTVEEGLTKDEVGAVIHKHMDQIRYCHDTSILYHPNLQGKLVVQFEIDSQGAVRKPAVQSSTLPDKTLEDCIMKKLAGWRFPRPKGGIKVNVSYPFLFKTLGQD